MAGLTEDGVPRCAPLPGSNLVPFGRCGGSALSGEYAPDSAKAEGSSIVDEPGEC